MRGSKFDKFEFQARVFQPGGDASIVVYVSPQNLKKGSWWYPLFEDLARRGCLSLVCVDEAHKVVEQGDSFLPDVFHANNSIFRLVNLSHDSNPNH